MIICKKNNKHVEYGSFLVDNQLFDKVDFSVRVKNIRNWSIKALQFVVEKYSDQIELFLELFDRYDTNRSLPPLPFNNTVLSTAIRYATTTDFELVKQLFNRYPYSIDANTYGEAAACGRIDILKYLLINHPAAPNIGKQAVISACKFNQLESLKFLDHYEKKKLDELSMFPIEKIVRFNVEAMDMAVKSGATECFNYLMENRSEGCTHRSIDHAAEIGSVSLIKKLRSNYPDLCCSTQGFSVAAENGHLETIKYLLDNRIVQGQGYSQSQAVTKSTNRLPIFKYLVEEARQPFHIVTAEMIIRCQLEFLEYLFSNKDRFKNQIHTGMQHMVLGAVIANRLDFLEYINKQKPLKSYLSELNILPVHILRTENVEITKFFLRISPSIFPKVMTSSVNFSDPKKLYQVVTTLSEHNITFNPNVAREYVCQVSVEMFQHFEKKYKFSSRGSHYIDLAATKGNLELCRYLYEQGYPVGKQVIDYACIGNHFDCLKYFLDVVFKEPLTDPWVINYAIQSDNLELVKYMANRFPLLHPTINGINEAIKKNNIAMLEFLIDRYQYQLSLMDHSSKFTLYFNDDLNSDIIHCVCTKIPYLFELSSDSLHNIVRKSSNFDSIIILLHTFKPKLSQQLLEQVESLDTLNFLLTNSDPIPNHWISSLINYADLFTLYHISNYLSLYQTKQ
ncbi:hypothetical protein PPL_01570 [Heterostelium album PN500]|uniref:Ankyrin repeat-containing protein n=1 Tax=Heterostelium pallidum (strain ATCC 26659 / Pp 5 / PN500) TaxID=670386 RepID=D3AZV6_HETP5|nr:hypothetical protein PPL_01570 [Heterostelium album PN500]EFA84580.1 hypothetical protein PPL_01570 [Heterostelium album PN500]|eukprot:XP_020436693.1 hypothetical protein PPL_01570 [Heterostelium album PN500]